MPKVFSQRLQYPRTNCHGNVIYNCHFAGWLHNYIKILLVMKASTVFHVVNVQHACVCPSEVGGITSGLALRKEVLYMRWRWKQTCKSSKNIHMCIWEEREFVSWQYELLNNRISFLENVSSSLWLMGIVFNKADPQACDCHPLHCAQDNTSLNHRLTN